MNSKHTPPRSQSLISCFFSFLFGKRKTPNRLTVTSSDLGHELIEESQSAGLAAKDMAARRELLRQAALKSYGREQALLRAEDKYLDMTGVENHPCASVAVGV